MGQEIVYCYHCQTRLLGSDFERGKAFRVGPQVACPDCVRRLLQHLPDPDAELERLKQQAVRKSSGHSSGRIPVVKATVPESSTRLKALPRPAAPPPPPPPKSQTPLFVGLGAGAVVLVIAIVVATSGGGGTRSSVPSETIRLTEAPSLPKPAPAPKPAPPVLSEADRLAREFDEIDQQILPQLRQDKIRDVLLVLDAAAKRHDSPEWTKGMDARYQRVEEASRRLARPLIDDAVAAAKAKDAARLDALRTRLESFATQTVAEEFDKAVAAATPKAPDPKPAPKPDPKPAPPKPAPPKATPLDAYRTAWAAALAPARRRDPAGALEAVAKLAAAQTDAAAKKEAEEDLADLKLAADALVELPKLLPRLKKGAKATLDFFAETGRIEVLDGTIVDVAEHGVSIQSESGFLEIPAGELGPRSLEMLQVLRGKRTNDARAVAILSAFDGLRGEGLPAKYAALPGAADEVEAAARKLFWEAETSYSETKTRGAAAEAYADLLEKRSSLAFVRRNRAFLEARLAATRDLFFFPDDLAGDGTFIPSKNSKVEAFWYSTADSPEAKAAANYVEAKVAVQPDQAYRAWAYVGGCCLEVFGFTLQGSGLSGPSAKNPRETVTAEPGGPASIAVKLPSLSLKRKHGDHLGPKDPERWAWVDLGRLAFAEPGVKSLRLVTDQKGFSVAYLVVSAVRGGPPRDAEVRELAKSRPPEDLGPTGSILREIWKGIGGGSVGDLRGNAKFKTGKPDLSGPISHIDSWNMGNDYGCRIRGYVHPPISGAYTFWIASDDGSELLLGKDDTPGSAEKIAQCNDAVGHREWEKHANQKSSPITLEGGKRYYIEVLQKQGGGGEHVAVGWQLPDGRMERAIPGTRLSAWGAVPPRRRPRPSFAAAPPSGPAVRSPLAGGEGGAPFEEAPDPRSFLRGLKYGLSAAGALSALKPLYLGASGTSEGDHFGGGRADREVTAPPGYAVGGMIARGSDRLNAFKLIFMRVSGSRLVPEDRQESGWIGTRDGGTEQTFGGDGTPVIGIHGKAGGELDAAGLLLLGR
jgi:hypothetical protein